MSKSPPKTLKRKPRYTSGDICVACGRAQPVMVAFPNGSRICEECAKKVIGIFKANRKVASEFMKSEAKRCGAEVMP